MEKEKKKILRYGQVIRLQGSFENKQKGVICSKGQIKISLIEFIRFTDKTVNFMTYEMFGALNNYRESLFQILPRGSFEIHDEYLKMHPNEKNDSLKQRLKTEIDQYFIMIQTKMNEDILFGAEVIFKHVESDTYLMCSDQCSDYRTDAFKLELSTSLSSAVIFKIIAFHSYQQDGQQIHFDEPLRIQSEGQRFWIDSVKGQEVFIDEVIQFDQSSVNIGIDSISFDNFRPKMRRVSKNSHRYEAVISHNGKEAWKFKLHEHYDQLSEKNKLKPYDLCVFQYTSINSYLSCNLFNGKLMLKEQKNNNNSYISLDSVWEIQPYYSKQQWDFNNIANSSIQQFSQVKQSELLKKSKIYQSQAQTSGFVLRHFLTGKVLTISDKIDEETFNTYLEDPNLAEKDQIFQLLPAKKGQTTITHGSFVKIVYNEYELQKSDGNMPEISVSKQRTRSLTGIESFYKRLQESDLDYKSHNVAFTNKSSQDAFALHKISDQMKYDLLYGLSSQEWLIQFVDILKLTPKEVESKFTAKILNKIIYIIKQLIRYVLNIDVDADVENSEALPIHRRQRTLKDLYIVEILIEVFFFISYKNGLESLFKHWKNEKEKIKQIFKLSYCLMGKVIKSNPQIKLHVSQWLELFLHQAMMIDDVNVQNSLAELLDDNYYAIQRFISRNSIKRIVEIMKAQLPHEKYLKILSSICVCKGKSITNNQIYCLNLFYQQISFEFRFQFKKENDKIMVLSHISKANLKWREFQQFYQDSLDQDEHQSWNYFISYFNLLSDICCNRNKITKKFVDENFPLDVLCSIIEDPDNLRINAIEPFLKLIHYAYIDCHHYPYIRRIARVHEWKLIEHNQDILRTPCEDRYKPENCDVKRVMEILGRFLDEFHQLNVKDKIYSQNLYTILKVLKSTIVLGFWKSIKDLQNLLQHLLRICSCLKEFSDISGHDNEDENELKHSESFNSKMLMSQNSLKSSIHQPSEYYLKHKIKKNKEKLTKLNLENLMIMKCKMLACDIIDLIFDMETNVRVTKATQIFKKLLNELTPLKKGQKFLNKSPTVPTHKDKGNTFQNAISTFKSVNQRHSRQSVIYQMIERTQEKQDENTQNMNILNMAAFQLKKKGKSDQDKPFHEVDKWVNEFRTLISDRSLFTSELVDQYSIELIFAELSLFENPEMPTFALSLLNRIYGQRKELVQNFEKVLIVAEGQTYELLQETKIISQKLQFISDRNILSTTFDNQKEQNIFIWKQGVKDIKESGIIQDLHYLCQSLKKGEEKDKEILEYENLFGSNELIQGYSERELNNRLHQQLIKAQDLHLPILQFIEFCNVQDNELLAKLLHQCYLFLSNLIWNHMDNKMELMKYKNMMYSHIQHNVGVIDFLRELFTNNKPLLFSEREIPFILNNVISTCNNTLNSLFYKSKLLDFLRVLLIFNSKAVKANQLLVLQKLQDSNYKNIMVYIQFSSEESSLLSSPDINSLQSYDSEKSMTDSQSSDTGYNKNLWDENSFEDWINDYQHEYEKSTIYINVNAQLTYLYAYFQLFSILVEDNNEINIEKCRQMHPFNSLVQLLSKCKSCWPLKRHLRAYLNRVYYKQLDFENISQQFIESDIYNILQDLEEIIEIKTSQDKSNLHLTKIQNPIRFKFLISYVFLTLEEILISLNMVFNNERFLLDLEEILTINFQNHVLQTHLQMFELATKLSQLQYFYSEQKYISHFCKVLMNIFRSIFKTFDISLLLIREGLYNSALQMTSVTEKFTIVQRKIAGDQVIQETTQVLERGSGPSDIIEQGKQKLPADTNLDELKTKLIDSVFNFSDQTCKRRKTLQVLNIFKQKSNNEKQFDDDENDVLIHKHKRLLNHLNITSIFQQFIEEEFQQVCSQISNIGLQSKKIYNVSFEVTTAKEFISNIIYMNISNPGFLRDDLRVFFLKMLGRIITEKNLKNKDQMLSVDQWTSDHWSDYKSEIENSQNFLNECGAADLIYQTFRESQLELRLSLTTECLGFAIAFLLGGNTKCQNSLLTLLKKDSSNTVLNNFALIIRKISKVIYNNFQIKVDHESDIQLLHVQTIDNFDYYDVNQGMMKRMNVIEPDDFKETTFKKQCLDLLCRFFRVLQLMSENNNVAMKRFIRQQTDEDDQVKLNSINFIEFTTMQFRLFLRILSKAVIQIPSFIMDFLIEIIQLPCVENQLTLCKTTFFEDASYMSQFFSNKQHQIIRLFDQPEDLQELQELQNKILLAVISVLEGNEDKIYQDLQNKLESQFLIDFLKSNLEVLGVYNANDMKQLLDNQDKIFSDQIIRVMNACIIIKKIEERYPQSKWLKQLQENQNNQLAILELLNKQVKNIEIVYEGKTMTIFYPSHPLFDFLSDHTKEQMMFKIGRETQREKILGLLEHTEILFYELEYNYKLNQMQIPITQKKIDILNFVSSSLSILLNLCMIFFYAIIVKGNSYFLHTDLLETIIIKTLSIFQLISQITLFIFFSFNRIPIILRKNQLKNKQDDEQYNQRWINKIIKFIGNSLIIINGEDDCLLLLIMVILSFIGVFVRNYIFVLHLVEIFSRLSLLKNVFQAISYNAKQLLVVALLGVLFVFAFSVLTFHAYFDDIYPEISEDTETCNSFITCMITLLTSGVIGNSMVQWDPVKFVYDMGFTVFFGLLFTNIISGIMIDTFAELRDQRQKIEEDTKNYCFICGISRMTCEKNNLSFEEHINQQHMVWNYVYYIYCLRQKDSTDYTGLEYWLSAKLQEDDIQWIPIQDSDDVADVQDRLLSIQQQLDVIQNYVIERKENNEDFQ